MKKKTGCLGYVGDDILPSYFGDNNKPLQSSPLSNQDSMESHGVFFCGGSGGGNFRNRISLAEAK